MNVSEARRATRRTLVEVARAWSVERGVDVAELLFRMRTARVGEDPLPSWLERARVLIQSRDGRLDVDFPDDVRALATALREAHESYVEATNPGMSRETIEAALARCAELAEGIRFDREEKLQSLADKALDLLAEGRREKVIRWLGFMQGVLWAEQAATLDELKSMNAPPGAVFDAERDR